VVFARNQGRPPAKPIYNRAAFNFGFALDTAEDFARGVRNPHFDELCRKVEVVVRHDVYKYEEIGEILGVSAESVMKRPLATYAKILQ
jgi:hypothetical protein